MRLSEAVLSHTYTVTSVEVVNEIAIEEHAVGVQAPFVGTPFGHPCAEGLHGAAEATSELSEELGAGFARGPLRHAAPQRYVVQGFET